MKNANTNETVLVFGSSGLVGGETARLLEQQGLRVRRTTSQKSKVTDGIVHVDLATGEGVKAAFDGVDRAFLLAPPGYADQYRLLSPLIQEAKRHALRKVVLMTAMGANAVETAPFRRAEIELEKSGLRYGIIRPNWFAQNFATFWGHGIRTNREIALPMGTAKVSFIDARDIAEVAVKLLTSSDFEDRDFDLTGPRSVDHAEVAELIAQATGKKTVYRETKPEEFRSMLLGFGLPADYVEFMVLIAGFLREGYSERRTSSVRDLTGHEPREISAWVAENKQNLI